MIRRKNGSDADRFSEPFEDVGAELRAVAMRKRFQPQRGDLSIDGVAQIFFVAPAERPVETVHRSLRWSYRNWWLLAIYRQVAPLELQTPFRTILQMSVQKSVQNDLQMFVQITVQMHLQIVV